MTDRLEVDLEGLESLAGGLERIRGTLRATREVVDTARGDLGSSDVAGALENFERHWRDGRERIDASAEALGSMLRESVAAYRATDAELTRSLEASMDRSPEVTIPRGAL